MGQHIVIIQGHPDACAPHFCHALADAYAQGAEEAGHTVERVDVAHIDFPLLRSQQDWEHGELPEPLQPAQRAIANAQHIVMVFPLWLGDMPALLKGFLEQVARPGFAFAGAGNNPFGHQALAGRSARIVVTMGMPAALYRFYFRAHSVRSLERNILGFVGVAPVRHTLIGRAGAMANADTVTWLDRMQRLGARAA